MNKFLLIALGILLSPAACLADNPQIGPVPNPGRWTVRLEGTPAPAAQTSPRYEVAREVWVLGTNRYEVSTWSDGGQGQLFINNTIGYEKSPTTGDVYVLDTNIGNSAPPSVTEWREFAWIKPELAKGTQTFAKRSCVVYEQETDSGKSRAFIDEETRLPVALITQGRTYIYEFQKAPDKLPGIDAVIGGAKQGYEAAAKKLSVDLKPR